MESFSDPSIRLRVVVACYTRAHSPPLPIVSLQFCVQSHFSNFGVQSHHRFSVLAFRAIVSFSLGVQSRSSPSFGIQSHFSSFGVQSHHHFSVSAFRAIVSFSFGVQSHSSPSFDIRSHLSSFWCSEPLSLSSLAFEATVSSRLRCSESSFSA